MQLLVIVVLFLLCSFYEWKFSLIAHHLLLVLLSPLNTPKAIGSCLVTVLHAELSVKHVFIAFIYTLGAVHKVRHTFF